MKIKIIVTLLVLVAFFSQSCEDYLKEELVSDVSASSYYTTVAGLEDAVKATYSEMKFFFGPERGWTMTTFGTDVHTNGADGSHKGINMYDARLNSQEGYVRDVWRDFYRGINQANAVLNRAQNIEGIDETLKNQRFAEVRFLRGFYYWILTETYGDIHLSLEETEGVEIEANKTSQSEIYTQAILPDLQFAVNNLPETQSEKGRVTKPAAEFWLAKAYLNLANDGDGSAASQAEALLSNVIDKYGFALEEDFAKLFGLDAFDEWGAPQGAGTAEDSPEIIFAVQNSKSQVDEGLDGQGHRAHLYFLMEYDKLPGMTRDVNNGRPWKRFRPTDFHLSLWDRDIDSRYDKTYKHAWISNNAGNIPEWTADEISSGYAPAGASEGDPKWAVGDTAIFIPGPGQDQFWDEERKKSAKYTVITRDAAFDDDPWFYNEKWYPTLNKWNDPTRPNRQHEEGQRDFYLMRLGEAYLLRAEARLLQGNASGAAEDLNVIRRRAAWDGQEEAMEITAGDVDIDFILDERARELDGEGQRWWDLVRTNKLVERVRAHNLLGAPNIEDHHVRRPIPQDQIDRTVGGYEQNCGYPGAAACN
jgi:hypothetical protein